MNLDLAPPPPFLSLSPKVMMGLYINWNHINQLDFPPEWRLWELLDPFPCFDVDPCVTYIGLWCDVIFYREQNHLSISFTRLTLALYKVRGIKTSAQLWTFISTCKLLETTIDHGFSTSSVSRNKWDKYNILVYFKICTCISTVNRNIKRYHKQHECLCMPCRQRKTSDDGRK
jgi:hypothetical protein